MLQVALPEEPHIQESADLKLDCRKSLVINRLRQGSGFFGSREGKGS
jgi:hypothetical protein